MNYRRIGLGPLIPDDDEPTGWLAEDKELETAVITSKKKKPLWPWLLLAGLALAAAGGKKGRKK
ncbi:MAG: hypothetical protein EOP50_00520 [Sphingobacteriales bacterium]|nr:MAG: hypothetical protein EOP50_00520 [Sphingobacteriales bacterium]